MLTTALVVRQAQLVALGRPAAEAALEGLRMHATTHFPQVMAPLSLAQQQVLVLDVQRLAASYDLHGQRDVCRFLNLALTYDWPFDGDPDRGWIHAWLVDPSVVHPSARLDLLVRQCLHQDAVKEQDEQQENAFALAAQWAPSAAVLREAELWLAQELNISSPVPTSVPFLSQE